MVAKDRGDWNILQPQEGKGTSEEMDECVCTEYSVSESETGKMLACWEGKKIKIRK